MGVRAAGDNRRITPSSEFGPWPRSTKSSSSATSAATPRSATRPSGAPCATSRIATTRNWKDKTTGEKLEETEWHRVVFYDRLAEIAGEYLKKGRSVYIEGRLKTRKWQDKDGNDNYTTEIIADDMQLLGGREGMGGGDEGGGGGGRPRRRSAGERGAAAAGGEQAGRRSRPPASTTWTTTSRSEPGSAFSPSPAAASSAPFFMPHGVRHGNTPFRANWPYHPAASATCGSPPLVGGQNNKCV